MHSFVQNKDKKAWNFYADAPQPKEILSFTMGKRNIWKFSVPYDEDQGQYIRVDHWHTDEFEGFVTVLQRLSHVIGKQYMKVIEGQNTCIRARVTRFQKQSPKFLKKLVF